MSLGLRRSLLLGESQRLFLDSRALVIRMLRWGWFSLVTRESQALARRATIRSFSILEWESRGNPVHCRTRRFERHSECTQLRSTTLHGTTLRIRSLSVRHLPSTREASSTAVQ